MTHKMQSIGSVQSRQSSVDDVRRCSICTQQPCRCSVQSPVTARLLCDVSILNTTWGDEDSESLISGPARSL